MVAAVAAVPVPLLVTVDKMRGILLGLSFLCPFCHSKTEMDTTDATVTNKEICCPVCRKPVIFIDFDEKIKVAMELIEKNRKK